VFRLLLTGTDDSSIIAKEDPKVAKGRQAGKVELLEGLLKATRERLAELGEVSTLAEERDRLTRIEASIQTALVERNAAQASVVPLQTKRSTAWTALKAVESKLAVLSELQTRFDLLEQQYESDLRRLEAIAEAGVRLDQLKEERCPMCGALAEHQHHEHPKASPAPADVSQACKAEAAKTSKLLQDLQTTRAANASEIEQLQATRDSRQAELDAISSELKGLMEQLVDVASKKVDELRARAETCRKAIEHLERIQELEELLEEANKPKKKQKTDVAGAAVSTAQADPFSREVEALLKAWHFPDLDRVSFSENDQDVVISGARVRATARAYGPLRGRRSTSRSFASASRTSARSRTSSDRLTAARLRGARCWGVVVPAGHQEALLGEREDLLHRRAGHHHREQPPASRSTARSMA
jgi:hypothetical protein